MFCGGDGDASRVAAGKELSVLIGVKHASESNIILR